MISPRKISNQIPKPTSIKSSSLHGVGYFQSEEQDRLTREKNNKKYFFHRYRVVFSPSQYTFFFFIHMIYLGILGLFIAIPAICSKKFKNLCSNLQITRISPGFFLQTLIWLSGLGTVFVLINENKIGDFMLLHIWITALILRSITIAAKYSSFDRILIKRHFEEKLTDEELARELLLTKWRGQGADIIENEINCACLRKDIDRRILKAAFMEEPTKEIKKELDSIAKEAAIPMKEAAVIEALDSSKLEYFDPTLVIHFFARKFNKPNGLKSYHFLVLMIFSYVYAFSPGFIRLARSKKFHGEETLEIIIFYFGAFFNGFMIFTAAVFYKAALIDLQRKHYVLKNIGLLISSRNNREIAEKKWLPSFNLADPQSVSGWINLRKITQNYGRRFFLRHELFMTATSIMIYHSITLAFGLKYILENLKEPITEKIEDLTYVLLIQFVLMSILTRRLVRAAAKGNKVIDKHIEILKRNRDLIQQFMNYEEFYFGDGDKKGVFAGEGELSFVQRRLVEEVRMRGESVKEVLEGLLKRYEQGVMELEDERKFEGVKLYGNIVSRRNVMVLGFVFIVFGLLGYQILVRK